MPKTETPLAGAILTVEQDLITRLETQDPSSGGPSPITWTIAGQLDGQTWFAHPVKAFGIIKGSSGDGSTPNTASTHYVSIFNKNCPWKCRVVGVKYTPTVATADVFDGTNGAFAITVEDGDGAASETFTDIIADIDLKADARVAGTTITINGDGQATTALGEIVPDKNIIAVDESLRCGVECQVEDAGAATVIHGIFEVELIRIQ